jgi:RHS repeat-associated protein
MLAGVVQEYYAYEGQDRVAVVGRNGVDSIGFGVAGPVLESYLFDGIDHPLRIARPGPVSTAYYYYELDLAGNVRGLRASGGASLGGYRYSAFGQALEDTTLITQPLRWKGRWFSPVAGGTYDVRARQWSPELGVFLSIDEFQYQDAKSTLWGWPNQSPIRFEDPSGRGVNLYRECVARMAKAPSGFPDALYLCLPFLLVPDPPAEFPGCAGAPPATSRRYICCIFTCEYNPDTGKSTRPPPPPSCPYRAPDADRSAENCYERCLTEPQRL